MRLAFLIPAPDMTEPWRWAFDAEADALKRDGVEVDPLVWTQASDLAGYDLILPLLVWGYHRRYREWLAFLDRVETAGLPVVNPPALLRWSGDKAYLAELGRAGVPSVPTIVVDDPTAACVEQAARQFGTSELVIKPAVSAGAEGTQRLVAGAGELPPLGKGRMMIQPFLDSIATEGEYSLMLFDGELSHSVVKRPGPEDFRVQPHFGGVTEACEAPEGAEQLAKAALAAAPARATYARVDIIRGACGELQIMELELVEPALFLHLAPDRGVAFTQSIRRAAERARKQPLAQR